MSISGITVYSCIITIVFFNITLLLVALMRRSTKFLLKNSTSILLVISLLSSIRLITPLDMKHSYIIQSDKVLPWIHDILEYSPYGFLSLGFLLLIIWGIGSIITLIYISYQLLTEVSKIKKYKKISDEQVDFVLQKLSLKRVSVFVSEEVDVPKVFGFFRANIYLPNLSVSNDELELILLHEYQHFRSYDSFIKLFYLLLSIVFWWNPIIHIFQKEVDYFLELRCDSLLTKKMNKEERLNYLHIILKVIKQTNYKEKRISNAISEFVKNSDSFIYQRFEVIIYDHKHSTLKKQIVPIAIVFLAFVLSYFVIIQPAYFPPKFDIEEEIEVTPDNSYIQISEDGTMNLYINNQYYNEITKEELTIEPISELKIIKKGN